MARNQTYESETRDAQEGMSPVRRLRKADRARRVGGLVDPVPSLQRQRREVARTRNAKAGPAAHAGPARNSNSIRTDRKDSEQCRT
jgi:hypothetical protein